jgi:hypothetical protein
MYTVNSNQRTNDNRHSEAKKIKATTMAATSDRNLVDGLVRFDKVVDVYLLRP